jgi:ubiquinone/menaquinone biosynthesis C-methylase UbiE
MARHGTELLNPFKILERVGTRRGWFIADLGCGSLGHFVFPAAQLVGGDGRVYAVDILKTAVHAIECTAKHDQYWNVYPIWSDIEVLHAARIPDASLDLTLVINNLFLSQNREGLVQEAIRLTKPGGLILCIEWEKGKTVIGPPDSQRLSIADARRCFHDQCLEEVEDFNAGDCHYALLFRRKVEALQAEILQISHPMHR